MDNTAQRITLVYLLFAGLEKPISDKVISSAAISRQIDRLLRKDGKKEARYIKLLSLGEKLCP